MAVVIEKICSCQKAYITTSKTINAFGQVVSATDGGGTITYTYHPSGQPLTIKSVNTTTTMAYDPLTGLQTSLTDPDAGTTSYTYDKGRLKTQTDSKGNITTMIYEYGRVVQKIITKGSLNRYVITKYDPDNTHLDYIDYTESYEKTGAGAQQNYVKTSYGYDPLGRNTLVKEKINNIDYSFSYEYDSYDRVKSILYPSGILFSRTYTGAFLTKLVSNMGEVVFDCTPTNYNAKGILEEYKSGGNTINNTYNSNGFLTSSSFGLSTARIRYDYNFEPYTRSLISRTKTYLNTNASQTETFTYDNLDRLADWTINPAITNTKCTMNYSANGNIVQKPDMGLYAYNATQPHAVNAVRQLSGGAVPAQSSNIKYNLFGKVQSMSRTNATMSDMANYDITYGPDEERRTSTLSVMGNSPITTIYTGNYEERSNGDCLHYVYGPEGLLAMLVTKKNDATYRKMYYLYTDYLGSLTAAYTDGTLYKEFNYDPWGRKRNPTNWGDYETTASDPLFTIGFTGQEYIAQFALYNYNGRMYDPRLGRFLSPDNYVQDPLNSQNFNRYGYCLNNPLKYTDPTGEFWHLIIGAIIGGTINWIAHGADFSWEGLGYFGIGAAAGALGAGVGMGVNAAIAGGSFGAGFIGTATVSSTGFIAGAATGASTGLTNGLIQGTGNGLLGGQSFGEAFVQGGLDQAWKQGLIGGATGGIIGGIDATSSGRDFWTGSYKQYKLEPALLASTDNVTTDSYVFPDDATVANADNYKVFYKSENGVTGIKDYVSPGKYIKNPVDGVATSKFTSHVFKIPDGGRVLVRMGGSVEFTNGYGFYDGLVSLNRAGWQNSQYFIDKGAYEGWKSLFNAARLWIK